MPTADTLARGLQAWRQQRTGRPVALKETHISWVLLADRLALKLKRPLRLPFLDFSIDHVLCLRRFADGALLSERLEAGLLMLASAWLRA